MGIGIGCGEFVGKGGNVGYSDAPGLRLDLKSLDDKQEVR